ncbi:unnamed protein product [Ectocarpus sp. 12 AP-2014]
MVVAQRCLPATSTLPKSLSLPRSKYKGRGYLAKAVERKALLSTRYAGDIEKRESWCRRHVRPRIMTDYSTKQNTTIIEPCRGRFSASARGKLRCQRNSTIGVCAHHCAAGR